MIKTLLRINHGTGGHWVGDAFYVNSLFSYYHDQHDVSPFLLLDYAKPKSFPPMDTTPGVGYHPHRGFETVTLVFSGEVEHQDTGGHSGNVSPGDVQWMTAGAGVLHEEKLSAAFSKRGGIVEMVQLWVNLPAELKLTKPKYQEIRSETIPIINLPDRSGTLRVIAGEFHDTPGAAMTFTPMNVWDVSLNPAAVSTFNFEEGHSLMVFVLSGDVTVNDEQQSITAGCVGIFSTTGTTAKISTTKNAHVLILSGEPIDEPIVGQGPFVMNTKEEIHQAIEDYHNGKFGMPLRTQ